MIRKLSCFSLVLIFSSCSSLKYATLYERESGIPKHARGVFIDDKHIITSGHDGNIAFSSSKEIDFKHYHLDSLEDFRDVHFSNNRIFAMNSGNLGEIWLVDLITSSRNPVFKREGVFLDGMDFNANNQAVAFGDPIDQKITVLLSKNGGNSWYVCDPNHLPTAQIGEAGFAASGSGIKLFDDGTIYIGTGGGETANLYKSENFGETWNILSTPMQSGGSYGIYSMFFWSKNEGVIIGGSYEHKDDHENICFITTDAGKSWTNISKGLPGYCSAINGTSNGDLLFASGRSGVYYSKNKGEKWVMLWEESYYTIGIYDKKVVFSGREGKLKVIELQ